MDKLNKSLFELLHSNPNYPFISSHQFPILQNGLLRAFSSSSSKTPTHPPYSWMIQDSIVKLDEERSLTTQDIISDYILKNYEGLPWAHNRYLKHHLDKLCLAGDLICDDDGTYNVPGKKRPKNLKRKLLKLKLSSKTKENEVVDEGNVARDQVTELSDTQVGIQGDQPQMYGRGERKRRRSYVFDEEDEDEDELLEKMIVDGEGNRDKDGSGKEMAVVETVNDVLLLKAGDVECKTNELDAAERKPHPQLDIVCSKQVKDQLLEVDRDLSEAMNLDHSCGGNIVRVPSESAIESNLAGDPHDSYSADLILSPVEVDPLASVSNIESDVIGSTIEKSDLKEAEPTPSASQLMIVPYVDSSVNRASEKLMISLFNSAKPIIVCGLYHAKHEQEKKKIQRHRKKSKPPQEKTEVLGQEPKLASSDLSLKRSSKTKIKRKPQSPKLKGATRLEDDSVKRLKEPMSSHPISLEKIFMDDEEPLSEVYEKCGNLKKHDMQRAKVGAEFPKELPSSQSFVEVTMEKKSALTNKRENPLYMELSSQETYCDNIEDDTSRKLSSCFLEESETKDSESTENQRSVITKSNGVELYSQPVNHPMDNKEGSQHEGDQHPLQKHKDDQETPLVLIEATSEDKTYLSDSHKQLLEHTSHQHSQQQNEQLKNSLQTKRGPGRPRKETNVKHAGSSLNQDLTTQQFSDKQNKQFKSQGRLLKEKLALEDASDPSSSLQKNISPKQDGGVRTRKRRATKNDTVVLVEPHTNKQERLSKQNKQLEKVGRRGPGKSKATTEDAIRPRGRFKNKSKLTEELGDKVDEALTSLSREEQDGVCGRASEHHSVSKNSQPRNNSRAQSPVKQASRAPDNPQHGDFAEASHVIPEALSAQGQVDVKDQTQTRRRSTRNLEPAKPLLDCQSDKQHDLELSDQRTLTMLTPALVPSDNHCPERVSVYLENELHGKSVELEQAKLALDNKTHTPLSNNSDDQEHLEESNCLDQAQEKMEVLVKVPKELTAKSVPIHVPLASRDQLRSRMKH